MTLQSICCSIMSSLLDNYVLDSSELAVPYSNDKYILYDDATFIKLPATQNFKLLKPETQVDM